MTSCFSFTSASAFWCNPAKVHWRMLRICQRIPGRLVNRWMWSSLCRTSKSVAFRDSFSSTHSSFRKSFDAVPVRNFSFSSVFPSLKFDDDSEPEPSVNLETLEEIIDTQPLEVLQGPLDYPLHPILSAEQLLTTVHTGNILILTSQQLASLGGPPL